MVAATVAHSRTAGTAIPGADFSDTAGSLNWGIGDDGFELLIFWITEDTLDEPNETIVFALSNPTSGTAIGSLASLTITITDNDVAGTLQFDAATVSVSEAAWGGTVTITVTRTGGAASGVTVQYETWAVASTATPNEDYTPVSGTLTFAAAETSRTFQLPITNDPTDETDETVVLRLTTPGGGGTLGAPTLETVTIKDDDPTGQIFLDGFESGNTAAWLATAP